MLAQTNAQLIMKANNLYAIVLFSTLVLQFTGTSANVTIASGVSSKPYNFTVHTGQFTSPGFPGTYPSGSNCAWNIVSPEPNGTLMLDFTIFDTENQSIDYVRVFDGDSYRASVIGTYSGKLSWAIPTIFSTQRNLYVEFYSDPANSFQGFVALFTNETACRVPRNIAVTKGFITSPYYPETYTTNKKCEWRLQIPVNQAAELTFVAFNVGVVDGFGACSTDYLEIRNNSVVVQRLCGPNKPANVVVGPNTTLTFISHSSQRAATGQGFKIYYEIIAFATSVSPTVKPPTTETTTSTSSPTVTTVDLKLTTLVAVVGIFNT